MERYSHEHRARVLQGIERATHQRNEAKCEKLRESAHRLQAAKKIVVRKLLSHESGLSLYATNRCIRKNPDLKQQLGL